MNGLSNENNENLVKNNNNWKIHVFSRKILIGDTVFTSPTGDETKSHQEKHQTSTCYS